MPELAFRLEYRQRAESLFAIDLERSYRTWLAQFMGGDAEVAALLARIEAEQVRWDDRRRAA